MRKKEGEGFDKLSPNGVGVGGWASEQGRARMIRVLIGAAVAAVAMFLIGFVFFATPLGALGTGSVDDVPAAAVQQSLAANLPRTGTYYVPSPEASSEQTVMYGQGPVATIHYNSGGFPAMDPTALIGGLVLDFVVALLIGAALLGIGDRVTDFSSRAKVVVLFSVAATAFMQLSEPIYYHHDWPHFIYLFIADTLALSVAGLIIARWFLPGERVRGTG